MMTARAAWDFGSPLLRMAAAHAPDEALDLGHPLGMPRSEHEKRGVGHTGPEAGGSVEHDRLLAPMRAAGDPHGPPSVEAEEPPPEGLAPALGWDESFLILPVTTTAPAAPPSAMIRRASSSDCMASTRTCASMRAVKNGRGDTGGRPVGDPPLAIIDGTPRAARPRRRFGQSSVSMPRKKRGLTASRARRTGPGRSMGKYRWTARPAAGRPRSALPSA